MNISLNLCSVSCQRSTFLRRGDLEANTAFSNHQIDFLLLAPAPVNGLVYGKNYRKAPYLMGKSMVSCRFSLKPIH